jgi:hypothetical protein
MENRSFRKISTLFLSFDGLKVSEIHRLQANSQEQECQRIKDGSILLV